MKVILLQDIEGLGKKYEVKEVADGYARNFLLPKKMAKQATEEALRWLEMQKEIEAEKAEKELKEIEKKVEKLEGLEVIIQVKVGEKGQLFEKVSSQKIADKLKELGFNIEKKQIDLSKPIEEVGEFPVKIKFEHNLEAEIKVVVKEE